MFVLWVFIIQLCCLIVHKLRGSKRSSVLQLGLNCLLLTTNNTGVVGWPVLIATVGQQSAVLSMLLGELLSCVGRSCVDRLILSRTPTRRRCVWSTCISCLQPL